MTAVLKYKWKNGGVTIIPVNSIVAANVKSYGLAIQLITNDGIEFPFYTRMKLEEFSDTIAVILNNPRAEIYDLNKLIEDFKAEEAEEQ